MNKKERLESSSQGWDLEHKKMIQSMTVLFVSFLCLLFHCPLMAFLGVNEFWFGIIGLIEFIVLIGSVVMVLAFSFGMMMYQESIDEIEAEPEPEPKSEG